ncbi:MAG: hypothetical protein EA339_13210 [Rhodobacteraceae bacterium]|nr:MAG: hypothetical protein EA339_13210 [Paracoccaceae bacterium]
MTPYTQPLRLKAKWVVRKSVAALIGSLLLATGAGFLTAAAWMVLASEFSPLIANLACGALFLGAGLIALVVGNSQPEPRLPSFNEALRAQVGSKSAKPPRQAEFPALMEAFLFGVATYSQMRNRRK